MKKISYEAYPVGSHLTDVANQFGAVKINPLGGKKFEAVRADGTTLRMLDDEGIGSTEHEEGFEEAWENA